MQTPPSLKPRGSSAIAIGWVCLGLGLLTFWIFGLGVLFVLAALALGIFLLRVDRVRPGVALVISSGVSLIICTALCILLLPLFWMPIARHYQRERLTNFIWGGATTQPRLITSTGDFPLFHGAMTVKVFETPAGDINYTVTRRHPHGTETMGPQVKPIHRNTAWCIYAKNAGELWVFDGEDNVTLVKFSGIHTTVSDLASVPDLLERAPRQFLARLPEDLKKEKA